MKKYRRGGPGSAESGSRGGQGSLIEILLAGNRDDPPSNSEMYAGFLPLVQDEVYASALKLRPWYDRNLRIMKQMLELTPQMCPVSALTILEGLTSP